MKRLLLIGSLVIFILGCESDSQPKLTPVAESTMTLVIPAATVPSQATAIVPASATAAPGRETARVTRVIDGDTIDVELDGVIVRIRYIGMDTPETVDPSSPVECFGPQGSERNQDLVEGRVVELEKDVSETDRFGRLLRYVYVDGQMINEELVLDGYATAVTFPPDVKYQDRLADAERRAREGNRGLWGTCFGEAPTPSSGDCPQGCTSPPPGCEIKGNINSEGVRIYHAPTGAFYDATVIDTLRGERWFCTSDEAVANGWRASQR